MKIQVINTGNELLSGTTVNSNLATMAQLFNRISLKIDRAYLVADRKDEIFEALHAALCEADAVILTGGLGSTEDDITRETVAEFFSLQLVENEAVRRKLYGHWRRRHGEGRIPKFYFKQSQVHEGATMFDNPNGTAPGLRLDVSYGGAAKKVYLIPGPPNEMTGIMENYLLEEFSAMADNSTHTMGFLVAGGGEPGVQQLVLETLAKEKNRNHFEVAYCANMEGTRVFISSSDPKKLTAFMKKLRTAFGSDALETGELHLAEAVVRLAKEQNIMFSFAESCSGGLLSDAICRIPGASEVFAGSVVAYSNKIKENMLGVDREILKKHGAVSSACAKAMAGGAAKVMKTQLAVSVTGIAGPGGGSDDKPVGLVHIAVKNRRRIHAGEYHFSGTRQNIRERSAARALLLLFRALQNKEMDS